MTNNISPFVWMMFLLPLLGFVGLAMSVMAPELAESLFMQFDVSDMVLSVCVLVLSFVVLPKKGADVA